MDDGPEAMEAAERDAVRAQARRVHLRSVAAGVAVAALAWFLP